MKGSFSDKVLLIDLDACVRCRACQVACREEQSLDAASTSPWCEVMTVGPRKVQGQLHMDFVPVVCFHCDDPLCARVCPEGAIVKDDEGLVAIDKEACTGCGLCVHACPYGRMFLDDAGTAGHCDLCRRRVNAGLEPACVQHCIGGALLFAGREEVMTRTSKQHRLLLGKICYISSTWRFPQALT